MLPLKKWSHMDRALGDRHGGFLHRLRQRRMRVTGASDILRRRAEFHGDDGLSDHIAGVGTNEMHAENTVGFGIGENLYEAVSGQVDLGSAVGGEWKLADVIGGAGCL